MGRVFHQNSLCFSLCFIATREAENFWWNSARRIAHAEPQGRPWDWNYAVELISGPHRNYKILSHTFFHSRAQVAPDQFFSLTRRRSAKVERRQGACPFLLLRPSLRTAGGLIAKELRLPILPSLNSIFFFTNWPRSVLVPSSPPLLFRLLLFRLLLLLFSLLIFSFSSTHSKMPKVSEILWLLVHPRQLRSIVQWYDDDDDGRQLRDGRAHDFR